MIELIDDFFYKKKSKYFIVFFFFTPTQLTTIELTSAIRLFDDSQFCFNTHILITKLQFLSFFSSFSLYINLLNKRMYMRNIFNF